MHSLLLTNIVLILLHEDGTISDCITTSIFECITRCQYTDIFIMYMYRCIRTRYLFLSALQDQTITLSDILYKHPICDMCVHPIYTYTSCIPIHTYTSYIPIYILYHLTSYISIRYVYASHIHTYILHTHIHPTLS